MKCKFLLSFLLIFCSAAVFSQIPSMKIEDVEKRIQEEQKNIVVINFWATFCKPCIAEIPDLIEESKKKDAKLLLVSVDAKSSYNKLKQFVSSRKWDAEVVWLNETDADYFCPRIDKSWSGSIPATLIVNKKTGYRKFFEEELSAAGIKKELEKANGY